MNPFSVWIRPLGYMCRVRVDGIRNAEWLVNRLGHCFVFKTSDPVKQEEGSSHCTFRVMYSSQVSLRRLERVLATIPEVNLMFDPA
jgi:hypothetical protein